MNRKILLVVNFLCCSLMLFVTLTPKRTHVVNQPPRVETPIRPIPDPEKPVEPKPPETETPKWFNYPAIRQVSHLGKVLSDIESHMPQNHIYRDNDKITWAHETTHGLSSNVRQKFSRSGFVDFKDDTLVFHSVNRLNGFYVLEDRAIVLNEPNGTLRQIAAAVPSELRGEVYKLYLVQQAASWNNEPLYVLDEWVAYSNGSAARSDLKITGRAETTKYMMEFCCYAICMVKTVNPDQDVKTFVKWHLGRCMGILKDNQDIGDISASVVYWDRVKANSELKQFCYTTFGQAWCNKTLVW